MVMGRGGGEAGPDGSGPALPLPRLLGAAGRRGDMIAGGRPTGNTHDEKVLDEPRLVGKGKLVILTSVRWRPII